MLMYRSVFDYMFTNVFLTFCILHTGPPKHCSLPPTIPLDGPGCVNNALS